VLQVQVDAANKQANTLTALLLSLQGQRAAASNSLSQISDSQVRALIRQELGDKSGSNAPLTPKEERSCAAAIQNADFCEKQRQAENDRADAEKKRADGIKAQYQELAPYTIFMEKSYTQLFNEKSTPEKSWKCLKLWRCTKAKIKAPDPKSLIRPAIVDPK
jgi:hypothetical protein